MPLVRKPSPAPGPAPAEPDAAQLAAAFASASDEARWSAARSAADAPGGLALLSAALARETVPRVREAMFTALARIGTPDAAAVAARSLRSDDAAERTAALDALRAMPAAAAGHLPQLLADPDADIRLLACDLARNVAAADANRLLTDLLKRDTATNVCAAAVEVLAETGDAATLPALADCATRFPDDPFLAFAIQIARDRIGSR
ncbi:MAG: HEAT repeat domain-containing protein [Tardiphaga sp.]